MSQVWICKQGNWRIVQFLHKLIKHYTLRKQQTVPYVIFLRHLQIFSNLRNCRLISDMVIYKNWNVDRFDNCILSVVEWTRFYDVVEENNIRTSVRGRFDRKEFFAAIRNSVIAVIVNCSKIKWLFIVIQICIGYGV